MKSSNTDAAQAFFNLLPIYYFIEATQQAPKRIGYSFEDYHCVYGKDPEADPGDEFDGVQLTFVDEVWNMSETEFFQGLIQAAEFRIKSHGSDAEQIRKIISEIESEIRKISHPIEG